MFDWKESAYFKSLDSLTRESILQSGMSFKTDDEIKRFVESRQRNQF